MGNYNALGIAFDHFLCSVIKKCIQKRTIATITNERGEEGALCNQRVLFAGDVPGLFAEGNCDNTMSSTLQNVSAIAIIICTFGNLKIFVALDSVSTPRCR